MKINDIIKTETYVELDGENNCQMFMPTSSFILIDDESGALSVKTTGSRKTIGYVVSGGTPPVPPTPQYRWVEIPGEYECSGTTKMSKEKKQVSYDEGSTWEDVSPLETRIGSRVIETESTDCGYVPPTPPTFEGKWLATYVDSHTESAECYDSTSDIRRDEITKENLVSVEIGDCVTSIGISAFYHCRSLSSITIPNSVTSIGGFAFADCSGLISVSLGNSVTSISDWAFDNCSSLTSVTIPNSVTTIGNGIFSQCSSLTSVTIPNSVTSISDFVFDNCRSLTSVTIPNSVTSIGDRVFSYCSGLTSVTIPNSVTSIGEEAFFYCISLTNIIIEATTPPTLGIEAFEWTNNCPLLVPAESVDAYKTAEGWSEYADRIQPIP